MGNYHARFLGGWARATAPGYPPTQFGPGESRLGPSHFSRNMPGGLSRKLAQWLCCRWRPSSSRPPSQNAHPASPPTWRLSRAEDRSSKSRCIHGVREPRGRPCTLEVSTDPRSQIDCIFVQFYGLPQGSILFHAFQGLPHAPRRSTFVLARRAQRPRLRRRSAHDSGEKGLGYLHASAVDHQGALADSQLPPLYQPVLIGVAPMAMQLRGFERVKEAGGFYAVVQEWHCVAA
jgi:hypothetical protein